MKAFDSLFDRAFCDLVDGTKLWQLSVILYTIHKYAGRAYECLPLHCTNFIISVTYTGLRLRVELAKSVQ